MNDDVGTLKIPFKPGDWVIDKNKPGQPGQYTGKWRKLGTHIMVQLAYSGGGSSYRPLSSLEPKGPTDLSIAEQMRAGRFGKLADLKRLITYEKLKGTLHDVIYSMEAAQIDFYPYQFKPVLKFINSPTERLIIACNASHYLRKVFTLFQKSFEGYCKNVKNLSDGDSVIGRLFVLNLLRS